MLLFGEVPMINDIITLLFVLIYVRILVVFINILYNINFNFHLYSYFHFQHAISLQIAGKLNGFEVKLNDDKLSSLLKIITSLQLPPPALKNTTDYYNELPVRTMSCDNHMT